MIILLRRDTLLITCLLTLDHLQVIFLPEKQRPLELRGGDTYLDHADHIVTILALLLDCDVLDSRI